MSQKRTVRKRMVRVGLLVAALIVAMATAAYARTGNGPISVDDENVSYNGTLTWGPNQQTAGYGHGGMIVSGYLKDENCNGDHVYVQAKVAGYGYTTLRENRDGCGNRVWDPATEVYDPAATLVRDGYVKVCNSDAFADTCTSEFMRR